MENTPPLPAGPTPPRRRLMHFVRVFVAIAISLPLIALLSLNIFINTGLKVLLNRQPERVHFAWSRAYCFIPGKVEVWGLQIRSQDPQSQWLLKANHARGTIDLPALLDYRFSASGLWGDVGSFRFRGRKTSAPNVDDPPSAAPPIEGLQNPPVVSPETLYGPPARLFRIQLKDMVIDHVEELWIEDYRFVGDARLETDLELLAHEWLQVDKMALDIKDGALQLGESTVASAMKGRVDFSVAGINPDEHPDQGLLAFMTTRVALKADVRDLRFLSFYLRKAPWLSLTGGTGALDLDLSMVEGRMATGSHLAVDADRLVARFLSYAVTGDAKIRATITDVDSAPLGQMDVAFLDYDISEWGNDAAHARGTGLRVTATTRDLTLSEPFLSLNVALNMPKAVVPDLSVYNAYLPKDLGVVLIGGTGSAHGTLEASTDDNLARGDLYLNAESVSTRMDKVALKGDIDLHVHLKEGRLGEGKYDIGGTELSMRHIAVVGEPNERQGKDNSRGWWGELTLTRATIIPDKAVFLDATIAVKMRDSVPFVTVFAQTNPLPGWVRGLLKIDNLSGEARVLLGEESLVIPFFALRGAEYSMKMQLRRRASLFYGSMFARYGVFSLGLGLNGEKSELHIFSPLKWYDAQPAP